MDRNKDHAANEVVLAILIADYTRVRIVFGSLVSFLLGHIEIGIRKLHAQVGNVGTFV